MKRRNTLTALCFLAALLLGVVLVFTSFWGTGGNLKALWEQFRTDGDALAFVEGVETSLNTDLDRNHFFIQLYGGVQRLSGHHVVEDTVEEYSVAKLSTGALNFVKRTTTAGVDPVVRQNAAVTAAFAQDLLDLDIPYRFLLAPQKIERGEDLLPTGVTDNGNANADVFLKVLDETGIPYTDLRPVFENNGKYADWFFRTDHHWKPEGAFLAWQYLSGMLKTEYGFSVDPALSGAANWQKTLRQDSFLGSQGKRVGTLYAGTDDFTLYAPTFDTNLTYTCDEYDINRSGSFSESVCFPERLADKDLFESNAYTYYAGGDYPIASIINHNNPTGPRVVLIRDSFGCAITPFLSLSCSELITIDLRSFTGDLLDSIEGLDPDLVLTLYTTGTMLSEESFQYDITN